MNAEEASLALSAIEIGMLGVAGYFIYEKFFADPGGDQEAPDLIKMIYDWKQLGASNTIGNSDMKKFVDKWNGQFEAAQKFIDDNQINDSTTLGLTEQIGKWMAGGLKGAFKELFSSVDSSINPDKNDWSSNDPVTQQVYEAVKDKLLLVIASVQQWKQTERQQFGAAAEAQLLLIIINNWQSGNPPPLFTDGDIADAVNRFYIDEDDAQNLRSYAAQYSSLLAGRAPPKKGNAALDEAIAYIYNWAAGYAANPSNDWQHWEALEPYRFMTDLTKLGADQDTIESVMINVNKLTNGKYGATDYATGVQGALDRYQTACFAMLTDSVAHPTPTCDYYYDVIVAMYESWGVSKKILPTLKQGNYATVIMTERNTLYGTRWGMPPAKYESSMIGLGH